MKPKIRKRLKPGWVIPDAVSCKDCDEPAFPVFFLYDGQMFLYHQCQWCNKHCGDIDWPFKDSSDLSFEDAAALGFHDDEDVDDKLVMLIRSFMRSPKRTPEDYATLRENPMSGMAAAIYDHELGRGWHEDETIAECIQNEYNQMLKSGLWVRGVGLALEPTA